MWSLDHETMVGCPFASLHRARAPPYLLLLPVYSCIPLCHHSRRRSCSMSVIPADFARKMHEYHGQEKASTWLASLPSLLADCAQRWQLTILPPFPNLSYHYAAPAERADGTPVVIKACSPTGECAAEAEALHLFQNGGMGRWLEGDAGRRVIPLAPRLPAPPPAHPAAQQSQAFH